MSKRRYPLYTKKNNGWIRSEDKQVRAKTPRERKSSKTLRGRGIFPPVVRRYAQDPARVRSVAELKGMATKREFPEK